MNLLQVGPRRVTVATPTIHPEGTEMTIVSSVAFRAPADRRSGARSGSVASVTIDLGVRPLQGEARFRAVIETPQIPAVGVVAALAAAPEAPSMLVVGRVASGADDLSFLESRIGVALFTRDHGMQPQQWKTRQVVFEEDISPPAKFPVTGAAIGSLLLAMNVIAHVTTRAAAGDLGLLGGSDMTLIAARLLMRSAEWKFGRNVMIKDRHFPVIFTVTALTIRPVSTAVFIVRTMTGNAIHLGFPVPRVGFVARVAGR